MKSSEYVSLGHPDKIADYISQYILDRYIEQDSATKYAVEVQIKDNNVTLAGEVTSNAKFDKEELSVFVKNAINEIGYNDSYKKVWGKNAISGEESITTSFIGQQSPEIAQGLNGWGDQGIFFGYAEPIKGTEYMPRDYALARTLNKKIFESGLGGLDIKTQVITNGGIVDKIIVAIPLLEDNASLIHDIVARYVNNRCDIIVNGTGRYVSHSSIADCGTTGRKLVVDFYGGNSKIGGGAPWTKDGSKADLTLNLYAREIAKKYSRDYGVAVQSSLACCIGMQDVDFIIRTIDGKLIEKGCKKISPLELIERYKLDTPIYASMCRWGLFGEYQKDKAWEQI